jgi:hypothetical protein
MVYNPYRHISNWYVVLIVKQGFRLVTRCGVVPVIVTV